MPTIIDRQVEAFRLSVQETSAGDESAFQQLMEVGTVVAGLITRVRPGQVNRDQPEAARTLAEKCRVMLGVMVDAQRLFRGVKADGVTLEGEDEFNETVVDLRDLIAELEGVAAGVAMPVPASEQERAAFCREFRKLAERHPPPQSWFDEDFTALAGPGGA